MNKNETNQNPFSLIADFDGDITNIFNIEVGETLPILTLRNMVLFPGVVVPVVVGRQSSLKLTQRAAKSGQYIGVVCQREASTENPKADDLYPIGTVAKVVRILELPDQSITVILQGFCRFELKEIIKSRPYLVASVQKLDDVLPENEDKEFEAMADACKDLTIRYLQSNDSIREEATFAVRNIANRIFLVNFVCTNLPFPIEEKVELLHIADLKERTLKLISILNRECQFASLKASIQHRTREEIDQQQKEYFLQQQIRNLQDELGENENEDVREIRNKVNSKVIPEEVRQQIEKELGKLDHIPQQSPDYNVQLSYLQTVASLPWGEYTKDKLNIKSAERILNKEHYGLEKVKERILEHLAVLQRRGDMKAPILCLYGPPGVGKTSLGRSIAAALGRKYARISLGGIHDEAEIRGHRRTYIGAMPGRIIKSLIKVGSGNPVFILDEIDKVSGNNYNGEK